MLEQREPDSVKATVLIVTYNHEEFIATAVDSALRQICDFPFEVLIADDGSADGTRRILDRYRASGDPRLRFFLPDGNLGSYGNPLFVEALARCRGRYMAWLDGDDYWTDAKKLQTMVDYLEQHSELSGAFHAAAVVNAQGEQTATILRPPELKSVYGFDDLLWNNFIPSSAAVYRVATLTSLRPYLDVLCLDWVLHLFQARRGGIGYVDRVMAVFREHDSGVWSGLAPLRRMEEWVSFMDRIPDRFQYDTPLFRRRLAREWSRLALSEQAVGRTGPARMAARKALRNHPLSLRHVLTWIAVYVCPPPLLRGLRKVKQAVTAA